MKNKTITINTISGSRPQRLHLVKLIHNTSDLGLIESKNLVDSLLLYHGNEISYEINISKTCNEFIKSSSCTINSNIIITMLLKEFSERGVIATHNERLHKLEKVLFSNQETLMEHMLNEMGNWESLIKEETRNTHTIDECKNIAKNVILEKYKKHIKKEKLTEIYEEITRINKFETKASISDKMLKFNEEFGEFNAEVIKFKGLTYKPYVRDELVGEMADTLQVLLSIYSDLEKDAGITLSEVLEKIKVKNIKWENKIKEYTINSEKND